MTVENSTLTGNSARRGGGICSANDIPGEMFVWSTSVVNSTLSGNEAVVRGGGIKMDDGTRLDVACSTIYGNTVSGPDGAGGGVYASASELGLRKSIVAGSPRRGNCVLVGHPLWSYGNNLSDTPACFPADEAKNDRIMTSLGLAPLRLNTPGSTMTHALQPGSPAIDGVVYDPADCGTSVTADQRGVRRPQFVTGPRCDIGAFELEGSLPSGGPVTPASPAPNSSTGTR